MRICKRPVLSMNLPFAFISDGTTGAHKGATEAKGISNTALLQQYHGFFLCCGGCVIICKRRIFIARHNCPYSCFSHAYFIRHHQNLQNIFWQMKSYLYIFVLLVLAACSSNESRQTKSSDTPTKGTITIAADESLKPIVDAEVQVFEGLNPNAHIQVVYTGENEAVNMVVTDSARIAIVARDFTPAEHEAIKNQTVTPRTIKMASDALAFILNTANPDTNFTVSNIKKLLDGTAAKWGDIFPASKLGPLQVVFDNPSSGATRMLKDSLLKGRQMAAHCFALKSNPEVIDYVEKHRNAVGIIGMSWISDEEDSTMLSFLKRVRVAEVIPEKILYKETATFKPIQANIALKQYPFCRTINMLLREPRMGLGTGFASFVASDPGQRIILKAGLVPAKTQIRVVQINE